MLTVLRILSSWQVILIGAIVLLFLPLVFYLASFDKRPVKIRRVPQHKKKKPVKAAAKAAENEAKEEPRSETRRRPRRVIEDEDDKAETPGKRPDRKVR